LRIGLYQYNIQQRAGTVLLLSYKTEKGTKPTHPKKKPKEKKKEEKNPLY
jgi:hypothetical protein